MKNICERLVLFVLEVTFSDTLEKWDPGPIRETWDPRPSTWDPLPGILYLGHIRGTRDLEPSTWDPIHGTLFKEQIRGTKVRKPILFIRAHIVLILIYSLEFSSQFLIIAK